MNFFFFDFYNIYFIFTSFFFKMDPKKDVEEYLNYLNMKQDDDVQEIPKSKASTSTTVHLKLPPFPPLSQKEEEAKKLKTKTNATKVKSEPKPVTKPETKPVTKKEPKPVTKKEPKPEPKPNLKSKSEIDEDEDYQSCLTLEEKEEIKRKIKQNIISDNDDNDDNNDDSDSEECSKMTMQNIFAKITQIANKVDNLTDQMDELAADRTKNKKDTRKMQKDIQAFHEITDELIKTQHKILKEQRKQQELQNLLVEKAVVERLNWNFLKECIMHASTNEEAKYAIKRNLGCNINLLEQLFGKTKTASLIGKLIKSPERSTFWEVTYDVENALDEHTKPINSSK